MLATRNGLEPSTSSVTGWRANRLHHRAKNNMDYSRNQRFCKDPIFSFFQPRFWEIRCLAKEERKNPQSESNN